MTNTAWNRRRLAGMKYQPKRIRLLLIGDSPPADLERYFYFEDANSTDPVFEEVCAVLFEQRPGNDKVSCLKELRRRGVFLIDLKPDEPRQGEPLAPDVGPLLINVGTHAPEKVILIGSDVYGAAFQPMSKAGVAVVEARVPFPGAGQEVKFRQAFRQALVRADLEKLIRPLPAPRAGKGEKPDADPT